MASLSPEDHLIKTQKEIDDTRHHLDSLDKNNDHYDEIKVCTEFHLEKLEEEYERVKRGEPPSPYIQDLEFLREQQQPALPIIGNQRPQTSDGNTGNTRPGNARLIYNSNLGDHFPSDSLVMAQRQLPSWGFDGTYESDTPVAPASFSAAADGASYNSGSGSLASPDTQSSRPQKRQRESIGLSNDMFDRSLKSMRTTPSPTTTAATTPTSRSSFEIPDDPTILALLGGDPAQDLRDMREELKEQEEAYKANESRRQQELDDELFARSLMEQDTDQSSFNTSSRPGSSTMARNTSQTVLDNQGRFRRSTPYPLPSPPAMNVENTFLSPSLPVKQENSYRYSGAPIKNEGPSRSIYNNIPSSDFIDLENEDFQFDSVADSSSSDLVEIDPSTFHSSGKGAQSQTSAMGAHNDYETPEASSISGWNLPGGNLGQSFANTASSLFNGAYDLLDQQIASYGNVPTGFGGTSVYGSYGQNQNFIDLDVDNQIPNLQDDLFNRHGINAHDPANSHLVASFKDRIDYVANDPTRTDAEIKSLLENIRPDEDLPPENREGTPEAMVYPLMEHQKLGLAWLKAMEEGSNKGGILADEMGLGKTIQALALLVANKSTDRTCKTTLIVCPVALLKQWDKEIRTKLKPNHQLKVYTLHSEKRHVSWAHLRTFDVVLTTFGTLATELKRQERISMNKRANPNWIPSGKNDYLPLLGDECNWFRVIIDEAQCIKNKNTKAALGACALRAKTRFCMTGTPMMNDVTELYSLIHFLRIKPYCDSNNFRRDFTKPLKFHGEGSSSKARAMRQLQALLKAILLRRTKKSEIDGKPILNLPERTTEATHAEFSQDESELYSALETRSQLQFNKYLKAGTVGRHYSNILVLLLRLRQACCHPHLIKDLGQASISSEVTPLEMKDMAKELAPDVIARIKTQSQANDDAALECPVCMDFTENATICKITDPSQAIAEGNAEGRTEAKCPNCRGKIMPLKAIDHKTFKQVYMPELLKDQDLIHDPEADIETTDDSDGEDTTEDETSDDEELDFKGNLKNFIVGDDEDGEDEVASETEDDTGDKALASSNVKLEKKKSKKRNKGKGKAKEAKPPKMTLAQLKKEGMRNAKARKQYLKRLNKEWIPSAKTDKTMELLRDIHARKDPYTKQCEKTIVFSQFTSLLDLLEVPMAHENWNYSRYDGSMSAGARNDAVNSFMEKSNCKIMLVSLKAGNAGLNLTCASQVIILDPFWNPFIEEQAIDRAHRIGQQKPVQVHRILVQNTVEDRILALQEKKRALIEGALDEKASQSIARLNTRELGFLFDVPT
ncbi:hypothetical protein ACLMJK_008569 [Lecanora helva]